jgi:hypothetical protein
MERRATIDYWWKPVSGQDVPQAHKEELEEHARDRICEMWRDGYGSGELLHTLTDDAGKTHGFRGWFTIKEEITET